MQIGALGDIHGAFDTVQRIMKRHADVPLWVCGRRRREQRRRVLHAARAALLDQGQQRGLRRASPRRSTGQPPAPTLHYLPNGGPHQVGPWRVAALGGTFAPSWYHTPAAALPPSTGRKRVGARR